MRPVGVTLIFGERASRVSETRSSVDALAERDQLFEVRARTLHTRYICYIVPVLCMSHSTLYGTYHIASTHDIRLE